MKKKILLHTCCAPCLLGTLPFLNDFDVSCFWYNPNIHPYDEYKSRLDSLAGYTKEKNINLILKDACGLAEFTELIKNDVKERCGYCYDARIRETAEYAKSNGYDLFTATLLVSPYQNHEKIKEICEKYAENFGLAFYYQDFRKNFREGQRSAREKKIYMQKYCGCIFSEAERSS